MSVESAIEQDPHVRVVDSISMRPMPGVRIWVRANDQVKPLGITDSEGLLGITESPPCGAELIVSAERYARFTSTLPTPLPSVHEVRLELGEVLAGHVQLPSGAIPDATLRVVAWRAGVSASLKLAIQAMDEEPDALTTMTSPDGTFRIDGVTTGETYHVAACGAGYIARPEPGEYSSETRVQAGDMEISLVVCPVFAADLLIIDNDTKSPVRCSPQSFGVAQSVQVRDPSARQVSAGSAEAALAGLYTPPKDFTYSRRFFAFVTDEPRDSIGPIEYSCHFHGYERLSVTFSLTPLKSGIVPVVAEARRLAGGFGSIDLKLIGLIAYGPNEHAVEFSDATIDLIGADSGLQYWMPAGQDRMWITDIPTGRYRVLFSMNYSSVRLPQANAQQITIDVADGIQKPLELDLGWTGAVTIHLLTAARAEYRGSVHVFVNPELGSAGLPAAIASEFPLNVRGLAPGWHTISLSLADRTNATSLPAQRVLIAKGEVTSLTFDL